MSSASKELRNSDQRLYPGLSGGSAPHSRCIWPLAEGLDPLVLAAAGL